MLPVEILDLPLSKPGKLLVNIDLFSALVIAADKDPQADREQEQSGRRSEVDAVSDAVVWLVKWQEGPGGDLY